MHSDTHHRIQSRMLSGNLPSQAMNAKSFLNNVPALNLSAQTEQEQKALAEAERLRAEREEKLQIIQHYARLKDKLTGAHSQHSAACAKIDRLVNWPIEALYSDFLEGRIAIEILAERISAVEVAKRHAEPLKKLLHATTIERAETELANFERLYKKFLEGVELEAVPEAPAIAATLPKNHFVNPDGSARMVQDAMKPLP
ncbi:MAG: hypothetical protein P4L87_22995 [Formivibrio sp.]|nr:hypothetical protein [Formivibrio sp.]